jgi:hypothetical protein
MAHTVAVTKMMEGSRHIVLHAYLKSDGVSSDLKRFTLIDPHSDDLCKKMESLPAFVIEEVVYDFAGFDASLQFDSGLINDNYIWVLPEGSSEHVDFRPFGGFADRSGLDGTGKLMITTFGLLSIGDQGSLIIKIRLKQQQ